jgi:hypothetical protein
MDSRHPSPSGLRNRDYGLVPLALVMAAYLPCVTLAALPWVFGAMIISLVIVVPQVSERRHVSRSAMLALTLGALWIPYLILLYG